MIGFIFLQERLLFEISKKINNGEITERGLARVIGISQPHMHHILKKKRRLPVELADRLLAKFEIDLLSLAATQERVEVAEASPLSRKGPNREERIRSVMPRVG